MVAVRSVLHDCTAHAYHGERHGVYRVDCLDSSKGSSSLDDSSSSSSSKTGISSLRLHGYTVDVFFGVFSARGSTSLIF
jgi:hypothetical protein